MLVLSVFPSWVWILLLSSGHGPLGQAQIRQPGWDESCFTKPSLAPILSSGNRKFFSWTQLEAQSTRVHLMIWMRSNFHIRFAYVKWHQATVLFHRSWIKKHTFLKPEIKTGKRFPKEENVKDCYQKINLGNQICSWQPFPDIRNRSWMQDALPMEWESEAAQTQGHHSKKERWTASPSFIPPSWMLIFTFSKYKYLAHSSRKINPVTTWDTNRKVLLRQTMEL